MDFFEMEKAVQKAMDTIKSSDVMVARMARMIRGRMKSSGVASDVLSGLKRELRDWDIHRKGWKK